MMDVEDQALRAVSALRMERFGVTVDLMIHPLDFAAMLRRHFGETPSIDVPVRFHGVRLRPDCAVARGFPQAVATGRRRPG